MKHFFAVAKSEAFDNSSRRSITPPWLRTLVHTIGENQPWRVHAKISCYFFCATGGSTSMRGASRQGSGRVCESFIA
jgi:hypothetical protein